jgi:hypothetical protein
MYNVNVHNPVDNKPNQKKPGKDNDSKDKDSSIENNINLDDDYDEFKLLKEQSLIVDHLKQLEDELFSNRKKPKIVYETPKGYLDSFMKPNKHLLSQELLERKSSTTKKTTTSTKLPNTKAKSNFHGKILML